MEHTTKEQRMITPEPDIAHLDREQVFLLFANFCGDPQRTAAALNISPVSVVRMADEEKWLVRLAPIIELQKSGKPLAVERAINAAVNLVQAHRLRLIIERTIRKLTNFTDEELMEFLEDPRFDKEGNKVGGKFNTRTLADLAAACEKAQSLTYQALGDSAAERAKRVMKEDDGDSLTDMHAKLAKAMAEAGLSNSGRALLFDAQCAQGQALAEEASKKAAKVAKAAYNPLNDDEH